MIKEKKVSSYPLARPKQETWVCARTLSKCRTFHLGISLILTFSVVDEEITSVIASQPYYTSGMTRTKHIKSSIMVHESHANATVGILQQFDINYKFVIKYWFDKDYTHQSVLRIISLESHSFVSVWADHHKKVGLMTVN